jgi:hypothetical protein
VPLAAVVRWLLDNAKEARLMAPAVFAARQRRCEWKPYPLDTVRGRCRWRSGRHSLLEGYIGISAAYLGSVVGWRRCRVLVILVLRRWSLCEDVFFFCFFSSFSFLRQKKVKKRVSSSFSFERGWREILVPSCGVARVDGGTELWRPGSMSQSDWTDPLKVVWVDRVDVSIRLMSGWVERCVLRSQSNPPKCLVVWSADRSCLGFSAPLVRSIDQSCMVLGPVFLINRVSFFLLIKIRESFCFHRPLIFLWNTRFQVVFLAPVDSWKKLMFHVLTLVTKRIKLNSFTA